VEDSLNVLVLKRKENVLLIQSLVYAPNKYIFVLKRHKTEFTD